MPRQPEQGAEQIYMRVCHPLHDDGSLIVLRCAPSSVASNWKAAYPYEIMLLSHHLDLPAAFTRATAAKSHDFDLHSYSLVDI